MSTNLEETMKTTDQTLSYTPSQETPAQDAALEVKNTGQTEEEEGQLTIDVYQTPDDVVVLSTIAGVKNADLEITLNNDLLTIRGSRSNPADAKQEDYFYQENYWGNFSRSVILPVDVDGDKVRAELKDGVLKVLLPKATKAKTKKIRVSNAR
jgi:HSP20 family protein